MGDYEDFSSGIGGPGGLFQATIATVIFPSRQRVKPWQWVC
ncbi:hypothetical protein D082_08690 [Synechocystis sp. PCC 6714]|nr:hypothetical protein D082_08690 [Synechocystis sp. PCC 6714]